MVIVNESLSEAAARADTGERDEYDGGPGRGSPESMPTAMPKAGRRGAEAGGRAGAVWLQRMPSLVPHLSPRVAIGPATAADADWTHDAAVGAAHTARGQARPYLVVKRLFDIVAATTLLIVLSPLMLLLAGVVRLDSRGPILFRQRRVGKHGDSFEMLKFRTMVAERRRRSGPPPPHGERRRVHKSASDPRVTRVGRFLRRTSLDELPQLWNILKGEMSLVGPRPELPDIVGRYELWQHARHRVTPGLTGWWQVNRDGTKLMHEATELDVYYVEHLSLKLDVQILFRTVQVVLRGRGAF